MDNKVVLVYSSICKTKQNKKELFEHPRLVRDAWRDRNKKQISDRYDRWLIW